MFNNMLIRCLEIFDSPCSDIQRDSLAEICDTIRYSGIYVFPKFSGKNVFSLMFYDTNYPFSSIWMC